MHFYLIFSIDVMTGTCRITVSTQSGKIVGSGVCGGKTPCVPKVQSMIQ